MNLTIQLTTKRRLCYLNLCAVIDVNTTNREQGHSLITTTPIHLSLSHNFFSTPFTSLSSSCSFTSMPVLELAAEAQPHQSPLTPSTSTLPPPHTEKSMGLPDAQQVGTEASHIHPPLHQSHIH